MNKVERYVRQLQNDARVARKVHEERSNQSELDRLYAWQDHGCKGGGAVSQSAPASPHKFKVKIRLRSFKFWGK